MSQGLTMPRSRLLPMFTLAVAVAIAAPCATAWAADPQPGPPLTIRRAPGDIVLDGDITDAGWQGADSITTWFETRVGDNVVPQVRNLAFLTYDDRYLYAGFILEDPDPSAIRAPIGDHDSVHSPTDYVGVIVDSKNDGKSAQEFFANARGVQYDAMQSDVSGEDSAPDFYWDSVGKITATGWTLEMRIPFSSLRYSNDPHPVFGMLLYRNYPRDRRYQFFSARLPRDVSCFVCNSSKMSGLEELPHGSHFVAAPFTTATRNDAPRGTTLGNPLEHGDVKTDAGIDIKWSPLASLGVDVTVDPDFSQVESDAALITANERFALSVPEKRPFFLENVDLFSTPMQAVYTRTITAPRAGLRATGRVANTSFTVLGTRDKGGGRVVLPGPQGSDDVAQDFDSDVGIVRARHDLGQSFVSGLATVREIKGGGHNRVFGPDFQWRPKPTDQVTGQLLWSDTQTPNRQDVLPEWDGRTLQDRAYLAYWQHGTRKVDWFTQWLDVGGDFRADDGFIPQVGYKELYFESGYTIRPKDQFLSRIRLLTIDYMDMEPDGDPLARRASVAAGMDGKLNSFIRVELNRDDFLVGTEILKRFRPRIHFEASPGRLINFFSIEADVLDEIDFANVREGSGTSLKTSLTVRPNDHVELVNDLSGRWLNVDAGGGHKGRLFSSGAERLRATYSFNARSFVRLIGQYTRTKRDASLYTFTVRPKVADFSSSALLAYKLNWQTVVFLGYGDQRTYLTATDQMEKDGRQAFMKVSYAWQQ